MTPIDTRLKLSALWLFILLNIIFRDIHQYALKSHLEMLLTGTYNGVLSDQFEPVSVCVYIPEPMSNKAGATRREQRLG